MSPTRMNSSAAEPRSGSSVIASIEGFDGCMRRHLHRTRSTEESDERQRGVHGHLDGGMPESLRLADIDSGRVPRAHGTGDDLAGATRAVLKGCVCEGGVEGALHGG